MAFEAWLVVLGMGCCMMSVQMRDVKMLTRIGVVGRCWSRHFWRERAWKVRWDFVSGMNFREAEMIWPVSHILWVLLVKCLLEIGVKITWMVCSINQWMIPLHSTLYSITWSRVTNSVSHWTCELLPRPKTTPSSKHLHVPQAFFTVRGSVSHSKRAAIGFDVAEDKSHLLPPRHNLGLFRKHLVCFWCGWRWSLIAFCRKNSLRNSFFLYS